MSDRYVATGSNNVTASPGDSVLAVEASANARGRVASWTIGSISTPVDQQIQMIARRLTAVGTRTAVTPALTDLDGPAAQLAGAENHTVEPTYAAGSELFDNGIAQRVTYKWVATPNFEWVIPASANAGIGWTPIHASYTDLIDATAEWEE